MTRIESQAPVPSEVEAVEARYARRQRGQMDRRYSILEPAVYMSCHERERALLRWMRECRVEPASEKRVLEIGCGAGGNLINFIRYGFEPHNLAANDLLPDRLAEARRRLPSCVQFIPGDASALDLEPESFDIVLQSTVFTSILDHAFQHKLARQIWSLVKPGGGVLWYDFCYNNPRNQDVAGIPVRRIGQLFPAGRMRVRRVTLAPPLARIVVRIHPGMYDLLNLLPCLRTHVLCWIAKPESR